MWVYPDVFQNCLVEALLAAVPGCVMGQLCSAYHVVLSSVPKLKSGVVVSVLEYGPGSTCSINP